MATRLAKGLLVRTIEIVPAGFEREAWTIEIRKVRDDFHRAELRVGKKVIHTCDATTEEWCLSHMRDQMRSAWQSIVDVIAIDSGERQTATADVVRDDRDRRCYRVTSGPYAGTEFLANAFDVSDVGETDVPIMFVPDDQFARRVTITCR